MNRVITFCKDKCCPVIEINGQHVILGDANGVEGITIWTTKQFKDFVESAKEGKFDDVIKN